MCGCAEAHPGIRCSEEGCRCHDGDSLAELRLQWTALRDEGLSGIPKEALITSVKDLARELLERTKTEPESLSVEIAVLNDMLTHWHHGTLSNLNAAMAIRLAARRIISACWCGEGACCRAHDRHTDPHVKCILR